VFLFLNLGSDEHEQNLLWGILARELAIRFPTVSKFCLTWVSLLAITMTGGFALAIRRSLSNVAADGFGAAALDKVSASTVIRHEIYCAAALVFAARQFYRSMEARLRPPLVLAGTHAEVCCRIAIASNQIDQIGLTLRLPLDSACRFRDQSARRRTCMLLSPHKENATSYV
jgi:hypothetical protein